MNMLIQTIIMLKGKKYKSQFRLFDFQQYVEDIDYIEILSICPFLAPMSSV
jgi:hypothetical protein